MAVRLHRAMPTTLRTRRRPRHLEDGICQALMQRLRMQHPAAAEAIFHVPNGGARTKVEAGVFRSLGQKTGVPDYFLPMASVIFPGLFLEVKTEQGSVSKDQKQRIALYRRNGFAAAVGWGFDDAWHILDSYIRGHIDQIECELQTILRTERKRWQKANRQ